MQLVRTFHPVGHGAFYTEQFYEWGVCKFTAVYDCGSKQPVAELKDIIDHCLKGKTIDALFISHLHSDHISGIKYLLDNYNCKKIFLPQLTRKQRLALLVENVAAAIERTEDVSTQAQDSSHEETIANVFEHDETLLALKLLYSESNTPQKRDLKAKIVKVPFVEGSIELTYDSPTKEIKDCNGTLAPGNGIKFADENFEWIYFPMNIKDDVEIDFGDLLVGISDNDTTEEMNFDRLANICRNSDNWETIKDNLKTYINSKAANEYSMTVYSGLKKPLDRRTHIMDVECCHDCECNCDCEFPYCDRYRRRCYHRIEKPGCLYMGDFVAENKITKNLIDSYGIYFDNAEVVQVPHHGSARLKKDTEKYGFQLFDKCKVGVISAQYGKYNDVPAAGIVQGLIVNRVCPKIVTQKSYTMLKMIYHIM